MEHPKVFISYSHDSPEHKLWVSELAAQLRRKGVDAILDQWEVGLGTDVTQFMERGIVDADRVLVICTDSYVGKANAGEGGVGYERMIVNAQLIHNLGTDKFIPIIRQASREEKTPTFLGTRVYIDFTDDSQFDEGFAKLIRELHNVPVVQKPPLGKSPFPSEGLDMQLAEIPEQVESASDAYATTVKIARAGDVLGWRQLVKQIKPNVFKSLVQWQQNELEEQKPKSKEQLVQVMDKAVEIVSPLMAVALACVESGREQFRVQKSLLDDLLNVVGWNPSGDTTWVNLPNALAYVYHSLHGGLSLSTSQLDLALALARVKIPVAGGTKFLRVWEMSELRGYAQSISGTRGGNSLESWKYLVEAYERWEWLSSIFEDELEYQTSLVAYYMALNVHELAEAIASSRNRILNPSSQYYFTVPLTFLSEESDITQRAISLLRRNPEALMELWTCVNVPRKQMENTWKDWIDFAETALLESELLFNQETLQNLSYIFVDLFEGV